MNTDLGTLVWADVHNRITLLESFLKASGHLFPKRIFLGDWFDDWNDTPEQAKETAIFLKELIQDKRNHFIFGNHDSYYAFANSYLKKGGYTKQKDLAIQSVLKWSTKEPSWDSFKLCIFEQGICCSHAGVNRSIFEHPIEGLSQKRVESLCETAIEYAKSSIFHQVLGMGIDRGGTHPFGGILWMDWGAFIPLPEFPQVVGHTPQSVPSISYLSNKVVGEPDKVKKVSFPVFMRSPPTHRTSSLNYNIDTNNLYFASIKDGEVKLHLTLDFL